MSLDHDILLAALPAYDVGDELGRGAWGVVIAATHRQLGREVAVKQLPRAFGSDPDVKRRFLAEAKLLASFDHPHIVPIFDFVEHEGMCLLVMERLTGGTVWTRFKEQGFTQDAACAVILASCAGLHYAHERGVLHRDVKPENMMFSKDGALKVTDFGIAKVVGGSQTMATRTGFVLGTPAYIAPEQAESKELGPATDVYAAGTVLFELLSGELPFPESTDPVAALYQRVHTEPRSLKETGAEVPQALIDVTEKAIARDVGRRYRDADQFGRSLAAACSATWGPDWLANSGVVVRGVEGMLSTKIPAPGTVRSPAPATVASVKPEQPRRGRAATHKPPIAAADLSPADLVPAAAHGGSPGGSKVERSGRPRWAIPASLAAVAAAAVIAVVLLGGGGGAGDPGGSDPGNPGGGGGSANERESEKIVRDFLDAWNENDVEKAGRFFAPEADIYGTPVSGAAEASADISNYSCKTEPTSVIADGNTVTTVNELSDLPGEDCGEYSGTTNTVVFTLVDGKITRMAYG